MEERNENALSLTQSQLQLWAGQKLNPNTPLHNTTHSFKIFGRIDEPIFQNAFQSLVNKIDVLRINFGEEDGIPFQFILEELEHTTDVVDCSTWAEADIKEWLRNRSQNKLDLSKKAFDTALLKVGEEKYIWFLNMHHLITDAVSATLIFKNLSAIYTGLSENTTDEVLDFPKFQSYIDFEKGERLNSDHDDIKKYWKDKVESIKGNPYLYGARYLKKTTESTRVTLKLGTERSEKLKKLAENPEIKGWTQNLTLFNLFATIYASFLHRVSGQKSISFGAPMHNRANRPFKETVGLFIEIFPIGVDFNDEDTFFDVLNRIKLESGNYLRNAQPGMVTPEISGSFNSILNFISASFSDFNGFEVQSEWMHPGHIDISHQMRCHVVDFDDTGELELLFDLNHSVFDEKTIDKVPQHFLNLMDAFLSDIHSPIGKSSLLSNEEIESKIVIGTDKPSQNLILNQFATITKSVSSHTSITQKENSLNYRELDEKSNQLAAFLRKCSIEKGQKVGIHMYRSIDYIVSVLAVLKVGASFIPISSDQPVERVKFILSDANCALLLTNSGLENEIEGGSTPILSLEKNQSEIDEMSSTDLNIAIQKEDLAYVLYTSGSTGNPKGVLISHGSLANYLSWAKSFYKSDKPFVFPLFTSIGFDLTITSTFLPLITGGAIEVYKESGHGPDISLMEVLEENKVNSIKLTPSHLALIQGNDNTDSQIRTMIVGGEDFKTKIAVGIQSRFGKDLRIFNEYGPTESTVGCIVSKFNKDKHTDTSVPIGRPIYGSKAYIFDDYMNLVPDGVIGSLFMGGEGLAKGYLNLPELTAEKFIPNPFDSNDKIYHTGDLARINSEGEYEYLGRVDEQVKLKGFRIELSDIEANLLKHNSIENTAVVLIENEKAIPENEVINCSDCGLPSNYPNTDFDEYGVCHVCNAFKGYKEQAQKYFKTEDELQKILISKRGQSPNYDCISLLSGGKDSTYILAQLINMGLKVLAFTLDNGYISDQAKGNINRIVSKLNVDHIYGTTEHMNKIFVDSLHRHHNVCNGCFKTIYTLATQIALDKQIPFVVTGLSRGQFFETRLTEELFWDENADVAKIDDTILEARKLYHQEEDAVKELMDVSAFTKDETFDKVQFVDFYRYTDVTLEEMLKFLKEKVDWVRPTDTGRSTNCTINQLGIYVHKKERGYSNYSFPYSWDVRMGHKTRTETLEEINEVIDEVEVKRIMEEIGYTESSESELEQKRLVGYYTGKQKISSAELANHLKKELPAHMVPTHFKHIDELPLTANGKVDKTALKALNNSQLEMETPFVAPEGEIEELLASIWKEVLRLKQVGVHDDFIALGGHSLAAIRVTARINEEVEMKFPLNKIFELPTIAEYAKYIEQTLVALLED
ncbi:amino acid adenylation domain-containing protein [Maribacter algarum]|uniref:Amino acid adenylation domain-containing protein n=1 Tax=Maribacter algarum (ex Zhang et al. 2020) TaxID=2578118 RepID=A0A5S3PHN9_9FLAO|nr:non-ribosomal peptide synthetase [Maribacter algarum]TMM53769.1 amino acid adenylation domain-containing protein [Maribacter algarum]